MKKLLLLASILLMTLSGFSQTDTSQTLPPLTNLSDDSVIYIPKTLALYMIRDLMYYDDCKLEVEYYSNLSEKYAKLIATQDTVIEIIHKKEVNCQKDLMICNELRDSLEVQNTTLKKDLKTKIRAKRFWTTTTFITIAAGGFIYYKWKEEQ